MRRIRTLWVWASWACLLPGVAGATVPDLVTSVQLLKGVERGNGTILPTGDEPFFVEFCVRGPIAEPPVGTATVRRPGGFFDEPIPLPACVEFNFESQQDLDAAFPSTGGVYQFKFSKAGFPADSINVAYSAPGPRGFADVVDPADEAADVDPESDLDVVWSIDPSLCFPSMTVADCASAMMLILIDPLRDVEVFQSLAIPMEATHETIPEALLGPETVYDLEVATYTGNLALPTATSGGDAVTVVALYQDINKTSFTTVPEPGAGVLGLVAAGAVGLLGRRRTTARRG